MKKIGIYGGTFDPVHLGHIKAAQNTLRRLSLDKIIFVPAGTPPHKNGDYRNDALQRLDMVRLAVTDNPAFSVSDYEIKNDGKSYTYKTLEYFKELFAHDKLYFLMGDEAYNEFSTWRFPEKIRSLATLVVMLRTGGFSVSDDTVFMDEPPFTVSSHEIREKLANGEDISSLVSPKVLEYIKNNKLYGSE